MSLICTEPAHFLEQIGLGLKIFDGYRPLWAQWILWEYWPDERYVASPLMGGRHTRGTTVDLTLVRVDGTELAMPTGFDVFSERAHADFNDLPQHILANRKLLQNIMMSHGFQAYPYEWWHFEHKDWDKYSPLNVSFSELMVRERVFGSPADKKA